MQVKFKNTSNNSLKSLRNVTFSIVMYSSHGQLVICINSKPKYKPFTLQ